VNEWLNTLAWFVIAGASTWAAVTSHRVRKHITAKVSGTVSAELQAIWQYMKLQAREHESATKTRDVEQKLLYEELRRAMADHVRTTDRAIEESEYRMGRTRQDMDDARKDFATQIQAAQEERNKLIMNGGKH
jgi:hypothetical protein